MPDAFQRLRVVVQDSKLANDPLLVVVKSALQNDPKVVITDDKDSPALILSGEGSETQVLSVASTGRVSGYMVKYQLSFRVVDAKGREMIPSQTVRLMRDYTFDPINVLAKEQEERELKRTMQRDAIQQMLRRLSRYAPPKEE